MGVRIIHSVQIFTLRQKSKVGGAYYVRWHIITFEVLHYEITFGRRAIFVAGPMVSYSLTTEFCDLSVGFGDLKMIGKGFYRK